MPGTVDLNTIPDNIIERVEILQDGASAIYGSDAIGGVVNIITDRDFDGIRFDIQTGSYPGESDGESTEVGLKWGGGNDRTHLVLSASYRDEQDIETADRSRSAYPNPDATTCNISGSFCSSFIPQGRFGFGPMFPGTVGTSNIVLNDGVVNDGMGNIPVFDPNNPFADDFHEFTGDDTFNYNGPGFNFLRTPNDRVNIYASARHEIGPSIDLFATFSYTNRSSATKAAPEPLPLGAGAGTKIGENFFISALNPFNPFGDDRYVEAKFRDAVGRGRVEPDAHLPWRLVLRWLAADTEHEGCKAGNDTRVWCRSGLHRWMSKMYVESLLMAGPRQPAVSVRSCHQTDRWPGTAQHGRPLLRLRCGRAPCHWQIA